MKSTGHAGAGGAKPENRRDFLTQAGAIATGGLISAAPVAAGVYTLIDPLTKSSEAPLVRIAPVTMVSDEKPQAFRVVADLEDAWNRLPQQVVGAVYLRRREDGTVQALNAICPHLGCYVAYNDEEKQFQCPCHTSKFSIDGERVLPCVSPRAMDELDVEIRDEAVYVKFQKFKTGIEEKKPKA